MSLNRLRSRFDRAAVRISIYLFIFGEYPKTFFFMALTQPGDDEIADAQKPKVVITDRDIVFNCLACGGELVVDRDGAGMRCNCPHCQQELIVPEYQPAVQPEPAVIIAPPPELEAAAIIAPSSAPDATPPVEPLPAPVPAPDERFNFSNHTPAQLEQRLADLNGQRKENQSQDTEMRGHINRATIDLHRLQLKLKKLQERQADIEAELAAIRAQLPPQN
jgi:DNA-directed RNA polymerase subunit RPC12/RpoP